LFGQVGNHGTGEQKKKKKKKKKKKIVILNCLIDLSQMVTSDRSDTTRDFSIVAQTGISDLELRPFTDTQGDELESGDDMTVNYIKEEDGDEEDSSVPYLQKDSENVNQESSSGRRRGRHVFSKDEIRRIIRYTETHQSFGQLFRGNAKAKSVNAVADITYQEGLVPIRRAYPTLKGRLDKIGKAYMEYIKRTHQQSQIVRDTGINFEAAKLKVLNEPQFQCIRDYIDDLDRAAQKSGIPFNELCQPENELSETERNSNDGNGPNNDGTHASTGVADSGYQYSNEPGEGHPQNDRSQPIPDSTMPRPSGSASDTVIENLVEAKNESAAFKRKRLELSEMKTHSTIEFQRAMLRAKEDEMQLRRSNLQHETVATNNRRLELLEVETHSTVEYHRAMLRAKEDEMQLRRSEFELRRSKFELKRNKFELRRSEFELKKRKFDQEQEDRSNRLSVQEDMKRGTRSPLEHLHELQEMRETCRRQVEEYISSNDHDKMQSSLQSMNYIQQLIQDITDHAVT
jgi:hypothetical protein